MKQTQVYPVLLKISIDMPMEGVSVESVPVDVDITTGNIAVTVSPAVPADQQDRAVDILRTHPDQVLKQVIAGLKSSGVHIAEGQIVNAIGQKTVN